jgi:predicted chitinase
MIIRLQTYLIAKKKTVFGALETAYGTNPRICIKIVLGYFNAQVDKEAVSFPELANYSPHSFTKDYGSRLIQFAVSRNIIRGSTFHPN